MLTDHFVCIMMEYATGGDLSNYVNFCYINDMPVTEDEARAWFQQFMIGLSFCHKNRVVNCDLKLSNTLLGVDRSGVEQKWWSQRHKGIPGDTNFWNVKIYDFGYAKHLLNDTPSDSRIGTLEFICPEVSACFERYLRKQQN
eukprot:TRINITY_DN5338_c0_g2_i3.p5 TRINITY_DN5338_c0_g2~~TRINITY_DN5338_c0_g2_i3.p5  ORF type:complete len:142 (-),score=8.61 TRINITY_DN5338_c0_g2_i3:1074-1499(-)